MGSEEYRSASYQIWQAMATGWERVRSLVRDAGFGEPRFEEVEVSWRFDDFDAYWRYVTDLAGGIALALQTLPEADREAVRTVVEQAARAFRTDRGLELPGVALNAATS